MALDLSNMCLIDLFGGQNDLSNKLIKAVGDPYKRLNEDYLRMLRAVRFSNSLNFTLEKDLFLAIRSNASKIIYISKERILSELFKMFKEKNLEKGLNLLWDTKLLFYIFPDFKKINKKQYSFIKIFCVKLKNNLELRLSALFLFFDLKRIEKILIEIKASNKIRYEVLYLLKNFNFDYKNIKTRSEIAFLVQKLGKKKFNRLIDF